MKILHALAVVAVAASSALASAGGQLQTAAQNASQASIWADGAKEGGTMFAVNDPVEFFEFKRMQRDLRAAEAAEKKKASAKNEKVPSPSKASAGRNCLDGLFTGLMGACVGLFIGSVLMMPAVGAALGVALGVAGFIHASK